MLVYINGKFYEKEHAKISVFDHGFLYGDGVFEGIRAYNGRVFLLEEHVRRLFDSAKAIMLDIGLSKERIIEDILTTIRKNNLQEGYLRVIVTRGYGDLGLDPVNCNGVTVVIIADKLKIYPQDFYEKGMSTIISSTRKNNADTINPKIKSLNYLNNIFAKLEARHAGVFEAIMLNREGYVCECTGDNIFVVSNGKIKTPPTYLGALQGITRDFVIGLSKKLNIEIREEPFTQYEIYTADECFLTGTAAEVIPVIKVDQRIIGGGKPGKITKQISDEFKSTVKIQGIEIYK
ncbi:MAG: branched-chain-amino-acid transaminase [Elusimicrobiota bacterium]|jgi:branched-chain amino acid aminotransferase|nr:branched-chain-amino-acid transaminase [Elusimicrobiota bacterium]